jgi:membrane protein DedA with SNARE-associated domain
MEHWVATYGYIGIILGTFLEGEATLLLAGIFANLGYFTIDKVILSALAGTYAGDCTFFFLGRILGKPFIDRHEILRSRVRRGNRIIKQYGHLILLMMRFLAGFRSVILLLLGCAGLKPRRFLVVNLLTSFVWTALISLLGYTFANVVYIFVHDIKGYEKWVIPLTFIAAIAVILLYRHFIKEKEEQLNGD